MSTQNFPKDRVDFGTEHPRKLALLKQAYVNFQALANRRAERVHWMLSATNKILAG